ncbi:hypothetical protein M885DRAFT_529427 [Pelagophyceae sp. CCMP2097]|nr:hypothetical protein M885DRAFT_529427 [Pelagophyceae sp. CCMP2097]|mmetsp:Transcript_9234/g.32454  ORF Transcript_9234/g.32454 Transcript_9234/m.32454 type:complete len:149 (+) Transcript_9234:65-511(+)
MMFMRRAANASVPAAVRSFASRAGGTAMRWNERGFGFIKPQDGGEDIFCHFSSIQDGRCLVEGDRVEFDLKYDESKGKYRAENVTGGSPDTEGGAGGMSGGGGYGGGGGGMHEPRPGDWTCPSCRANVFASKSNCFKCGEPKPAGNDW